MVGRLQNVGIEAAGWVVRWSAARCRWWLLVLLRIIMRSRRLTTGSNMRSSNFRETVGSSRMTAGGAIKRVGVRLLLDLRKLRLYFQRLQGLLLLNLLKRSKVLLGLLST